MALWKYRDQLQQAGIVVGLLVLMCVLLIYQFTYRTPEDAERETRPHYVATHCGFGTRISR